VPVASAIDSLLNRRKMAPYGATAGGGGYMTTLQNLQSNPNLRLSAGKVDLTSAGNLTDTEKGHLDSTLRAQGQSPADFAQSLNLSRSGQRRQNRLLF
jgi:hypothetical protein